MTYHTLLSAVAVVAVSVTVSFFVVSPIARDAASVRRAEFAQMREKENAALGATDRIDGFAQDPEEYEDYEEGEYEDDDAYDDRVSSPTPAQNSNVAAADSSVASSGYTASQVAQHTSAGSCWTIVSGEVYDLTSFVTKHPGGEKKILRLCGIDGTQQFMSQHGGDTKPEQTLASLHIGTLIK